MMKSQLSQYLCLMNEIKLLQKETDAAKEEFEDACKEVRKVSDTVRSPHMRRITSSWAL